MKTERPRQAARVNGGVETGGTGPLSDGPVACLVAGEQVEMQRCDEAVCDVHVLGFGAMRIERAKPPENTILRSEPFAQKSHVR